MPIRLDTSAVVDVEQGAFAGSNQGELTQLRYRIPDDQYFCIGRLSTPEQLHLVDGLPREFIVNRPIHNRQLVYLPNKTRRLPEREIPQVHPANFEVSHEFLEAS